MHGIGNSAGCKHGIGIAGQNENSVLPDRSCFNHLLFDFDQISKKTVLIVDDDPLLLRLMTRFLSLEYEVVCAHNANRAARFVDAIQFSSVLTDYEMPSKDGIWLLRYSKQIQPCARRVLTSSIVPSDLEEHVQSGLVEQFMAKPWTRQQVLESLLPECPPFSPIS